MLEPQNHMVDILNDPEVAKLYTGGFIIMY